jgi:ribonuclease Z
MSGLETAYRRDIEIRIADEELPPEGVAVIVDEFEHDGIVCDRDGVRVIAFEVDHGPAITPAYGYRIEYDGRVAVISGDTRYNENVIRFGTGADLLVHEVAIARPELMSEPFIQRIMAHHTSACEAGAIFSRTTPDRLDASCISCERDGPSGIGIGPDCRNAPYLQRATCGRRGPYVLCH